MSLRLGYGTNGFSGHRLEDACRVIADLGYVGVGLTIDQPHLDPFADDVSARTDTVARVLAANNLALVVETGSRYVLDPWHKHEPTLVSGADRERRVDLLVRAVRIGERLGAEAVSFWSGTLPAGTSPQEGWRRLVDGIGPVLDEAAERGVTCAFEPEPGMFVSTLDDALSLLDRLGNPEHLRLTLDVGHLVCNEDRSPTACVQVAGGRLANVQLDDMRRDDHEHLEFGDGSLDLPAVLQALVDVGYDGLAAVELPRHSHAAPVVARRCMQHLTTALAELKNGPDPVADEEAS